jgi:hypothetical protein
MTLYKAHNHSYKDGQLTIHYTRSAPGTPYPRVRTLCGQSHRKTYFAVVTPDEAVAQEPVNCLKCLATAQTS